MKFPRYLQVVGSRTDNPSDRVLDKDRFRQDLGNVAAAYQEVMTRIQEAPLLSNFNLAKLFMEQLSDQAALIPKITEKTSLIRL
jgi:phosphoribosylaminoimidazole-succinocarboxamide synthase